MNTNWLLLGLPCLAGLLMAVQGSINGQVSKSIGTLESNFLMHLIGLAAFCGADWRRRFQQAF